MNALKALSADILSGSATLVHKGVQGGKLVVDYGTPAVVKSAYYTQQVSHISRILN